MNKQSICLAVLLMFFIIPFVSAVPPVTTVQSFPTGLVIVTSPQQNLKLDTDYMVHIFVHNSTNGARVDNNTINCHYFLETSQGILLLGEQMTYNLAGDYFTLNVLGGNFSEIGEYNFGLDCHDAGDTIGGSTSGAYIASNKGYDIASGNVLALLIFLFFVIFIGTAVITLKYFERGVNLEMDLADVVKAFLSFGVFLLYYWFAYAYWGDVFVMDMLEVFLWVVGFMNTFVVSIMFGFNIIKRMGEGK